MAEGGFIHSKHAEKQPPHITPEGEFVTPNDDPMFLPETISDEERQSAENNQERRDPRNIDPSQDVTTAKNTKRKLHFHANTVLSGDHYTFDTKIALRDRPASGVPITPRELTPEFDAQRKKRQEESSRKQSRETTSGVISPSPAIDVQKHEVAKRQLKDNSYIKQREEASRSLTRVNEDIDAIIQARNNAGPAFTRQSGDVFFRVESLAIAGAVHETTTIQPIRLRVGNFGYHVSKPSDVITEKYDRETGKRIQARKNAEILPSRPEYIEDELIAVANLEFNVLVPELKEMQAAGAPEDTLFKKILEQVNAFPYRRTANSLLKALADRNRERFRPKQNFLFELAHANELPGLNCEGRAKMFSALLEAIGYNPESEIFINFPGNHVQTLLKRKDGTWLAFEGSNRRPFIKKFNGSTTQICTLQEWKYTLYGLPTENVIESVNPVVEDAKKPEEQQGKQRPEWQESKFATTVDNALDAMKDAAALSLSGIVAAFAGSANEAETVKSAYPVFQGAAGSDAGKNESQRTMQDAMNTYGGHAESLQKILAPRIAAAKRAFGGVMRPAVVSALAAGCYYSYGALRETPGNEPSSSEETKNERVLWEEATEAVVRDMKITLVPPSNNGDWETAFQEERKWAPYTYEGVDFVLATAEASIKHENLAGEAVHTVQLSNDTRTISPGVFESMIKEDVRQWSAGRSATTSTWIIEGKNLDIHAAERALADIRHSGTLLVPQNNIRKTSVANGISITWKFEGDETDEITLSVTASDTGERRVLGDKWSYTLDKDGGESTLEVIEKMEGRILKKQYGSSHWQAPVTAMQRKAR